ncbi:MAG: hypothetical protein NVSMB13_18860 [Mycobacteriales bacterium]
MQGGGRQLAEFRSGGAAHAGSWIEGNHWIPAKKIHVQGSVAWPSAQVRMTVQGSSRVISSNDLPNHPTGTFPIARFDPAYAVDTNPNAVLAQQETFELPAMPAASASPRCTSMGPVGIMSNGVLLFNALDAAGRDAVAHEVQDSCDGHPQSRGAYHYHGYSPCLPSRSTSTVIGYALDGFGITGPQRDDGTTLSTADLDECHGTTSTVTWDGQTVRMYHYVMTADYPYSIGCFKGAPVRGAGASGGPRQRP